ncbi:tRNA (adenosine(37)-N6)-threonylcarbamoyltransferase complex dimerization subunit type 1 TsaB [Zafaria cholistanensis]|uniref:tRNA (Adenosine(37)-N6)-threonylcarbamoyltransferase complex dimerization subunit type 1 TsaB n=1 Tax=Zafaria cholistanensis TaxID=1682741 RepID=A0A5A7NPK8_9MICC|nr:tRNA (adenosine(37)-N6)-threonylcarbamoyltransferase complex dimerization subunit type 1 TsaB [Zafaria cholistanensis]GER21718.1 tRNA (adenosine(37)-N6)-threonylcarbamoyltransferase complex dimerization subunit type 1 TsaB [Zafaria cholistanensis]
MLILAIDTSAIASAALLRSTRTDGAAEVLASFASTETNTHAEVLAPAIQGLLTEAGVAGTGLDRIVAGVGPGPFTGLRVGIATARTLGFAWNVPVDGAMSLDAIAWDVLAAGEVPAEGFTVAIDARRRELYWARYGADGSLAEGPRVSVPGSLPAGPVYGAGAGLYADRLAQSGAAAVERFRDRQPTAASLGAAALRQLARGGQLLGTTPLYLRESDAKVPAAMQGHTP